MHQNSTFFSVGVAVAALVVVAALSGCGGGSATTEPGSGGDRTETYGTIIANLSGSAQAPVASYSSGAVVTGIAGANFFQLNNNERLNNPVVYVSDEDGDEEIWVMNQNGTLRSKLTDNTFTDSSPSVSPDGTRIVFSTDRDGQIEVYTMNIDGSGAVRVTNHVSTDRQPSWSSDGTKIAFASARDGSFEIYRCNSDGTGVLPVTNGGADTSACSYPKWSPDGTRIAYSQNAVAVGNYECYVQNIDGTNKVNVTNNAATDQNPVWSPDGNRILFQSTRGGSYDIWTINGSTFGDPVQLGTTAGTDWEPSFNQDATKVFFSSSRDDVSAPITFEIYSVTATGGTETRLTFDTGSSQSEPSVAPAWQTKLVGPGARFGTNCAGFLLGTSGTSTTSFLSFDTPANVRGDARVVKVTDGAIGLTNMVFNISSISTISNIKFYNAFGATSLFPNVVSVGVTAATTNALVFYSGTGGAAGNVTSVLPYAATRSKPAFSVKDGVVTVRGEFSGLVDGTGRDLAPGVIREVQIEEKTGKAISFN